MWLSSAGVGAVMWLSSVRVGVSLVPNLMRSVSELRLVIGDHPDRTVSPSLSSFPPSLRTGRCHVTPSPALDRDQDTGRRSPARSSDCEKLVTIGTSGPGCLRF